MTYLKYDLVNGVQFIYVYYVGFCWLEIIIGWGNGLVPLWHQAITLANDDYDYFLSLGIKELNDVVPSQ